MNQGLIRSLESQLDFLNRFVDSILIIIMLGFAVWVYPSEWSDKYTITAFSAVMLFSICARANNLYRSYRVSSSIMGEFRPLMLSWTVTVAGLLFLGYALKVTQELSRVSLGLWMIFTPLTLITWRRLFRGFLQAARARGYNTRSVVIVGRDVNAHRLAENILQRPWTGLRLKGFIDDNTADDVYHCASHSWSVLGGLDNLFDMARHSRVDIVYICIPMSDHDTIDRILRGLGDTTASIYMVPDYYEAEIMQGQWVTVGSVPTITVIDNPTEGFDSWIKRTEDVVVASFALVLLGLPMVVIAALVALTSKGPVFYKQLRYGLSGSPIEVWKFRSMCHTGENSPFVQAQPGDQRITPFGALLRKTSLDELPQLFNVLGGSMSIVGPRPHAVAHNEEFRGKIAGYMLRHKVKPGMTGLAQVNGYRGETETDDKMHRRVQYDVEYINSWSLWRDLVIILRTPRVLLLGTNAH